MTEAFLKPLGVLTSSLLNELLYPHSLFFISNITRTFSRCWEFYSLKGVSMTNHYSSFVTSGRSHSQTASTWTPSAHVIRHSTSRNLYPRVASDSPTVILRKNTRNQQVTANTGNIEISQAIVVEVIDASSAAVVRIVEADRCG